MQYREFAHVSFWTNGDFCSAMWSSTLRGVLVAAALAEGSLRNSSAGVRVGGKHSQSVLRQTLGLRSVSATVGLGGGQGHR
eukprot:442738-Rhodomonas_salina.1